MKQFIPLLCIISEAIGLAQPNDQKKTAYFSTLTLFFQIYGTGSSKRDGH